MCDRRIERNCAVYQSHPDIVRGHGSHTQVIAYQGLGSEQCCELSIQQGTSLICIVKCLSARDYRELAQGEKATQMSKTLEASVKRIVWAQCQDNVHSSSELVSSICPITINPISGPGVHAHCKGLSNLVSHPCCLTS
jgi:hypothetical protein